jgi:hypothetical protein
MRSPPSDHFPQCFFVSSSWERKSRFLAAQQLTLADLTRGAPQRHVLMQANKNGFFRVLDRTTCSRYIAQPAMDLVR